MAGHLSAANQSMRFKAFLHASAQSGTPHYVWIVVLRDPLFIHSYVPFIFPSNHFLGIRRHEDLRRFSVRQFWRFVSHDLASTKGVVLDWRAHSNCWYVPIIFASEFTVMFTCLQEYIDMRMYEDHLYINFDKTSGTMPSSQSKSGSATRSGSASHHESAMWQNEIRHCPPFSSVVHKAALLSRLHAPNENVDVDELRHGFQRQR